MRVDAHHHMWDLAVRDQPWTAEPGLAETLHRTFTLDDLKPLTDAAGIEASVLVQTITVAAETPEFLKLAEADPLVKAVTGWTDLTEPDVAETLQGLKESAGGRWLKGIRHQVQGEPDPAWLIRDDVLRGLKAVGEAGLVYELLTLPHQLPAAVAAVTALPETSFVLDHCSKPPITTGELEPWATRLRELAELPNVTCKLSGLVTEASKQWSVEDLRPYTEVVLAAFGPDRVMFGSDWPVCLLHATYVQVVEATEQLTEGLSEAERDAVWGGTAARIYGITPGL
ncbi:amidohydrolase family protein [Kutzneria sp. CA-103260]|uniref:amidohydrolase family protein n=1 Tax=Kutzneria sp. CA-103260 TaxID=2802641 RepID=UPI001BA44BB7|nr:amidohydrolase family protein [Kutzneria sp. CA-103260]QUQ69565.1 amidohydrolase [Kutzneria sp. CA-103260]